MTWLVVLTAFVSGSVPSAATGFGASTEETAPKQFHSSHLSLSDRCLLSRTVGALLASDHEGFTNLRQDDALVTV